MRVVETTPRTRARRPARWRDRRLLKRVSVVEDMAMVVAGLATNSDLIRWRFPRHKLKNVTNWWIWEGKTDGPRGPKVRTEASSHKMQVRGGRCGGNNSDMYQFLRGSVRQKISEFQPTKNRGTVITIPGTKVLLLLCDDGFRSPFSGPPILPARPFDDDFPAIGSDRIVIRVEWVACQLPNARRPRKIFCEDAERAMQRKSS